MSSEPNNNKQQPLWLFLGLGFAWVIAALCCLPRSYAEADDPAMVDFLQHQFYVPFMTVLLSRFMQGLYHLLPSIPWYALYHYGWLSVSLALFLKLLWEQNWPSNLRKIVVAIFAITFLAFITRMTFTCTAILMGGLSFIYLTRFFQKPDWQTQPLIKPLLYGCLLALCFLTRWEAVKSLIFLLPLFGLAFLSVRQQLTSRKLYACLSIFVLPFCLALLVEKTVLPATPLALTDQEQMFDTFMSYHQDNIGFGISGLGQYPGQLKKFGWTTTDNTMYQHWLYMDEQVFSTEHVKQYSALTKPMITQIIQNSANFQQLFTHAIANADENWFKKRQVAFLLLGMALLLTACFSKARNRWLVWAYIGIIYLGSFLMSLFLRFPMRVAGPVFYSAAASLPLFGRDLSNPFRGSSFQKIAACVALGLFLVPLGETVYQCVQVAQKQQKFNQDFTHLAEKTKGGYLLRESGLISIKWLDPLVAKPPLFPEVSAGWAIFSGPYYKRLKQVGLSQGSQVLPWMVNHPRAFVLVEKQQVAVIEQFIKDHYRLDCQLIPAGALPSRPHVLFYQIRAK